MQTAIQFYMHPRKTIQHNNNSMDFYLIMTVIFLKQDACMSLNDTHAELSDLVTIEN